MAMSPRAPVRSLLATVLMGAVLVAVAAGCDSGPSGPGELRGTLEPPAEAWVGAALLTVSGEGVRGVSAGGSTRVFSAGPGEDGTYRVLLVNTGSAGALRFRVEVRDVGAPPPATTILELVDEHNVPLTSVAGARVRFDL